MDRPEYFEIGERCAFFRPVCAVSLIQAIELVGKALRYCGAQKISRLLVNVTGVSGLGVLSVGDRYVIGEKLASAAPPGMKVVVVTKPEMIDPGKFGVTVAENRGLRSNVFSDEIEAITWLISD